MKVVTFYFILINKIFLGKFVEKRPSTAESISVFCMWMTCHVLDRLKKIHDSDYMMVRSHI